MNCPRDGTRLLAVRINGCRLRKCQTCGGMWLQHNDLDSILKLGRRQVEADMQVVPADAVESSGHADGYMRCPECRNGRLQRIHITFTQPITIDRCDNCLGYWIDRSELDAIVAEEVRLETYARQAIAAGRSTTHHPK